MKSLDLGDFDKPLSRREINKTYLPTILAQKQHFAIRREEPRRTREKIGKVALFRRSVTQEPSRHDLPVLDGLAVSSRQKGLPVQGKCHNFSRDLILEALDFFTGGDVPDLNCSGRRSYQRAIWRDGDRAYLALMSQSNR